MQRRKKCFIAYLLVLTLVTTILSGCGNSLDVMESQTDTELFEQGKRYYEQGEYKKSLQHFLYVKDHFIRSSYAGVTRFYAGESYFALKKYEDAAIEYKSFLSFFPNDQNAAAAQYKLGVCYLEQSPGPDRDQTMIQKALTELQNVGRNYPDHEEYVRKAGEKIQETQNMLAIHEFVVAEFYRKEKLYTASNRRLSYLMKEYSDSGLSGDAVFTSGLNYLDLKDPEKAKEQFLQLIRNYPQNRQVSKAQKQLAKLGVANIPEPVPQIMPTQGTDINSPKTTSPPLLPLQQAPSPEGYIVLKRENTVFTDLIRDDGIKEGMILEVYRDNIFIGSIRIIEIQQGFSIGEIESLTPNATIQEEDRVVFPQKEK